ncbi:MAG: Bax inhibitor-1 family protein [Sphingomonas sp.]
MANGLDPRFGGAALGSRAGTSAAAYDAGLRAYMLSVYNYMASAVLLTGLIALAVGKTSLINALVQTVETSRGVGIAPTGLGFVVMLAPLAFGLPLSFSRGGMKLSTLQFLFWGYAVTLGLSFSTLFIAYADASIAQAFFAAAAGFAGLSLYGYTTKRDLAPLGPS